MNPFVWNAILLLIVNCVKGFMYQVLLWTDSVYSILRILLDQMLCWTFSTRDRILNENIFYVFHFKFHKFYSDLFSLESGRITVADMFLYLRIWLITHPTWQKKIKIRPPNHISTPGPSLARVQTSKITNDPGTPLSQLFNPHHSQSRVDIQLHENIVIFVQMATKAGHPYFHF